MKNARTYYDVLGVSRDATLEEITTAKMHWRKSIILMQMYIKILIQPNDAGDPGGIPVPLRS